MSANFNGASLAGADFSGADVRGASFFAAHITGTTRFRDILFYGAEFEGANLREKPRGRPRL